MSIYTKLSPNSPLWSPKKGFYVNLDHIPPFPNHHLNYHKTISYPDQSHSLYKNSNPLPTTPPIGQHKITYVPRSVLHGGILLNPKSLETFSPSSSSQTLGTHLLSNFILIRTKRFYTNVHSNLIYNHLFTSTLGHSFYDISTRPFHTSFGYPLALEFEHQRQTISYETHADSRYEWLFAYIIGYNTYTSKHTLLFQFDNIYFKGFTVDLNNCTFQYWPSSDMSWFMHDIYHPHNNTLSAATDIQRIWRGYYSRTYWDLPALIHIV